MSDMIYLGRDVKSFQTAPKFAGYDQVILNIDDNNYVASPTVIMVNASKWDARDNGEYQFTYVPSTDRWRTPFNTSANAAALKTNYGIELYYMQATSPKNGDVITVTKSSVNDTVTVTAELTRSGSVLKADCPLVSPSDRQRVADNLLWKVYAFEYQPFSASGAYMTPAAEVGDAVTAYGIYAGMFEQETTFSRLMLSNIGSALSDEAEAEMQYDDASERQYKRKAADTEAMFAIFADKIAAAVTNEEFASVMEEVAGQISAKVSTTGGEQSSFSWSLTPNGFFMYANGSQVFKCDRYGITVTGDGTFTGNVYAKNIKYGGTDYGYLDGSGLKTNSVSGGQYGQIKQGSILGYRDITQSSVTGGNYGNLAGATIAYGNTDSAVQGTLRQVGTNKSNIEAINGYFTGTANFNYAIVNVLTAGAVTLGGHPLYYSDGYVRYSY